jgi:hypothetical protein
MTKIIAERGTGKTKKLMLVTKENHGILVCANPQAMHSKALAYGITGFDIISYKDYLDKSYDNDKKIYIDELEEFINFIINDNNFDGYSMTIGD